MELKTSLRTRQAGKEHEVAVLIGEATNGREQFSGRDSYHLQLTLYLNGDNVAEICAGRNLERSPLFRFSVNTLSIGDKVAVTWLDSLGYSGREVTVVA